MTGTGFDVRETIFFRVSSLPCVASTRPIERSSSPIPGDRLSSFSHRSIDLSREITTSFERSSSGWETPTWPLTYPCATTAPPLTIDAVDVVAVVVDIDLFVRRINLPSTSIALNRRPATNGEHRATIFQRRGPVFPFDRSVLPGSVVDRVSTTTDGKCVFPDG